jgi:hypothetical protein
VPCFVGVGFACFYAYLCLVAANGDFGRGSGMFHAAEEQISGRENLLAAEVGVFEVFVSFFYGGTGLWLELFKQGQEAPWIEGL